MHEYLQEYRTKVFDPYNAVTVGELGAHQRRRISLEIRRKISTWNEHAIYWGHY